MNPGSEQAHLTRAVRSLLWVTLLTFVTLAADVGISLYNRHQIVAQIRDRNAMLREVYRRLDSIQGDLDTLERRR